MLLQRIVANITIKNGFNSSIGWNLGKKNKSIHLFDPFTSMPIIGTKNKEIREIKKNMIEYLNSWSVSIEEKIKLSDVVTYYDNDKPNVRISTKGFNFKVSMSHDGDYVIAIVISNKEEL